MPVPGIRFELVSAQRGRQKLSHRTSDPVFHEHPSNVHEWGSALVPDANPHPKEAKAVLQAPVSGTGGRVRAERVYNPPAETGAVRPAESQRPAGEDLVSEPENEEEETANERASFVFFLNLKKPNQRAGLVAVYYEITEVYRCDFCIILKAYIHPHLKRNTIPA